MEHQDYFILDSRIFYLRTKYSFLKNKYDWTYSDPIL